jgi:hypothetical protein
MLSKVDQTIISKVDRPVDFQDFHPTTVDFSKEILQQSIYDEKSTVDFKACPVCPSFFPLD